MLTFHSCTTYSLVNNKLNRKHEKLGFSNFIWKNDHGQIEYWENKNIGKPTFVLVHGFGANSKFQWHKQLDVLTENYHVIIPNLNYFGKTKTNLNKYEVQDQVEIVKMLLDYLGVKNAKFMGVSYGGFVVMEMTRQFPSLVNELFVIDSDIKFMSDAQLEIIKEIFEVETIPELFAPSSKEGMKRLLYVSKSKKTCIPAVFFKSPYKELYEKNNEHQIELVNHLLANKEQFSQTDYQFNIPVHLIWGDNDLVFPPEQAIVLQEYLKNNTTVDYVKKGGHMPCLNNSKEFNSLLMKYLNLIEH